MRLRVFLLPVLAPILLLGFVMAQIGENKDNAKRSLPTKRNLVAHVEERLRPTDEQEILA